MTIIKHRFPSAEAYAAIIKRFGWRDDSWMQDWPLEISHEIDLQYCISEYCNLESDDEKYLLIQGVLYALAEINDDILFIRYITAVREILEYDFEVHKSTIYYWTLYENAYSIDEFNITPMARELWKVDK